MTRDDAVGAFAREFSGWPRRSLIRMLSRVLKRGVLVSRNEFSNGTKG